MICNLQPDDKEGENANRLSSTHMSVLPIAGQDTAEGKDAARRTSIFSDDVEIPLQTIADCGKHLDYYERNRLRVGIIIKDIQTSHPSLAALHNPASSCKVTALTVLKPPPSFSSNNLEQAEKHLLTPGTIMRKWMKGNNLGNHSEPVAVLGGEEGAEMIVQREDVDAIFIIVPDEIHQKYCLSALRAKKHVLVNDPVSISLPNFNEQLEYARKFRKFVQSSTAFIHQYRVRQFVNCVIRDNDFGRVTCVNAQLSLCNDDLPLVGVNKAPMPIGHNQGCIRRLGRYCVLFGILLFGKVGSSPVSVKVNSAKQNKGSRTNAIKEDEETKKPQSGTHGSSEPVSADCTVKFSDDRVLTFKVEYSTASSTRQKVEVKAGTTMASMLDFVFPHPDGLATYRVYEDIPKKGISADIEVMHGEAIDIAGGPKHDVVMWRKFAELCRALDEVGWDDIENPITERVHELAIITLHTKSVLNALMKSYDEGFIEVPVDQQSY